jgi:hypothetical protein
MGPLIVRGERGGQRCSDGSLLSGCFVLAFGFKRVRGTAAFTGMLAGRSG